MGTNGKDTYNPEILPGPAKEIAVSACLKYFDGFATSEANVVWKGERGQSTFEYTLVRLFEDAKKKENIYKVADEPLVSLNQNSILIVTGAALPTDFYSGTLVK